MRVVLTTFVGAAHVQITAEDPPPEPRPETCQELWEQTEPDYNYPGDFDNNCEVNLSDLAIFVESWLLCNDPQGDPDVCSETLFGLSSDMNRDCDIDNKDKTFFTRKLEGWGCPCKIVILGHKEFVRF